MMKLPRYLSNPSREPRIGKTQRSVLEAVQRGDDRCGATSNDYADYCRRRTIAHEMRARGWLYLLPHNHPAVISGEPQWRITEQGLRLLGA